MATQTGDEAKKLWEMIGDIRICMMTTIDDDGSLRSRPMAGVQDEFEGELWFFTRASSHKAQEVESHRRVNLRSEEHTSELQSLMRISYAVFCLKNQNQNRISIKT